MISSVNSVVLPRNLLFTEHACAEEWNFSSKEITIKDNKMDANVYKLGSWNLELGKSAFSTFMCSSHKVKKTWMCPYSSFAIQLTLIILVMDFPT